MKIDFTPEEIGVLAALVFDSLNNKDAERLFDNLQEETKEMAIRSFIDIKAKMLGASIQIMADIIRKENEEADE